MKLSSILTAFVLGILPFFQTIAGGGGGTNCSPNLVDSHGNTIILQCTTGPAPDSIKDFRVIIGYTTATPIIDGNINWAWVDKSNSYLTIKVDNRVKVQTDLNHVFQDEEIALPRGAHTFQIRVILAYYPLPNGFQATPGVTSCSVVLDVQASGKVYPKYIINQDNAGQLFTYACNFWI